MLTKIITLMYIAVCFGYSATQTNDKVTHTDEQDIYEVQDGESTIKFAYPRPALPALREIVYYHMVERPYNDSDAQSVDVNDTRPFTNSHGLEFETTTQQAQDRESITNAESIPEPTKTRKLLFDLMKEKYARTSVNNEDKSISSKDRSRRDVKWIIPKPPALKEMDLNSLPLNARLIVSPRNLNMRNYEKREDSSEMSSQMSRNRGRNDIQPRTYGMDLKGDSGVVWNTLFTDPGLLYDNAKAREENESKRIPEPPVLREFDMENLSPYVRTMVSADKLNSRKYENKVEEIETDSRMQKMFRNINIQMKDQPENKPKTYGMYLKDNSGVVWNNLSSPGLVNKVEESSQKNKSDQPDDFLVNEEDNQEKMKVRDDEADTEIVPDNEERKEPMTRKTSNQNKPKFDDFLETEEFWNWLSSWTSLAMESILEHVDNKIRDGLLEKTKPLDEKTETNESDHKNTEKDIIDASNKNASNKTSNRLQEKYNITETKKNLTTDVRTTETSNVNTTETPARIEAKYLYGNTVGSEKVTNIFIFYPNKDSIIDSLIPQNVSIAPVNVFPTDTNSNITDNSEKSNTSDKTANKPNQSDDDTTNTNASKEKSIDNENLVTPHATTTSLTSESTTEFQKKDNNNNSDTTNNDKTLDKDKKLDTSDKKSDDKPENSKETKTEDETETITDKNSDQEQEKEVGN